MKIRADLERSLLDAWMPPEGAGPPVAAIATTYEFDPHLWELQLLPRFLGMERFQNHSYGRFVGISAYRLRKEQAHSLALSPLRERYETRTLVVKSRASYYA